MWSRASLSHDWLPCTRLHSLAHQTTHLTNATGYHASNQLNGGVSNCMSVDTADNAVASLNVELRPDALDGGASKDAVALIKEGAKHLEGAARVAELNLIIDGNK